MHGDGISPGTTTAEQAPNARLLDLTRLVSRAGRVLTGVDRVERAYLSAVVDAPVPAFGLVRTTFGFVLLDRDGMRELARCIDSGSWGAPDRLSRLALRLPVERKRAESDLRRFALARTRPRWLARMLRRNLPDGTAYINVGLSNISGKVLESVKSLPGARIAIMIHDTIPLDHPEWQTPKSVERFGEILANLARYGDLALYNSDVTRKDAERHLAKTGRVPRGVVAHLGIGEVVPKPEALPEGLPPQRPYFVVLGTIEPRKNHAFLLDLWAEMVRDGGAPPPHLVIVGQRGWMVEDLSARLDNLGELAPHVTEVSGLTDGAVAALLCDAAGLLFPSGAEGFGLPALEAMALGTPVVASDLPVLNEIIGDYGVYAPVNDGYLWRRIMIRLASGEPDEERRKPAIRPPGWDMHFNVVLSMT